MAWNTLDIGAQQHGTAWNTMDIGAQQGVPVAVEPAPAGGQIINVMFSKLWIPIFWMKQGRTARRGFIKKI